MAKSNGKQPPRVLLPLLVLVGLNFSSATSVGLLSGCQTPLIKLPSRSIAQLVQFHLFKATLKFCGISFPPLFFCQLRSYFREVIVGRSPSCWRPSEQVRCYWLFGDWSSRVPQKGCLLHSADTVKECFDVLAWGPSAVASRGERLYNAYACPGSGILHARSESLC